MTMTCRWLSAARPLFSYRSHSSLPRHRLLCAGLQFSNEHRLCSRLCKPRLFAFRLELQHRHRRELCRPRRALRKRAACIPIRSGHEEQRSRERTRVKSCRDGLSPDPWKERRTWASDTAGPASPTPAHTRPPGPLGPTTLHVCTNAASCLNGGRHRAAGRRRFRRAIGTIKACTKRYLPNRR